MKTCLLATASLAALVPAAAYAQDSNSPNSQTEATAGSSDVKVGVTDIVVTAQRRSERLQDVPVSVTAATGERLAAVGIQSSQDLSVITPGLTIPQTSGYTQPRIRGVGTTSNGPGVENPVATYIDGVYIASAPSSLLTLNNIERVEVLKGPQGTLFGRNATGGLIQIITKDPSHTMGGAVNLSYGNYETIIADAYVTGGLSETIAADVALRYEHQSKGFGTNLFNGRDVGKLDHDFAGRMKLLVEPSDATQIRLSFDYESRDSDRDIQHLKPTPGIFDFQFLGPFPLGGTYDVNQNYEFRNKLEAGGASLQIDHDFGAVALKSITAYRKSKFQFNLDLDLLPFDGFTAASIAKFNQFSQELQLSSTDSGPLKWVAGLYYFRSKDGWQPIDIGIGALVNQNAPGVPFHIIDQNYQKTDAGAAYAQATYEIVSNTNLTVGGRYNYERKTVSGTESFTAFGAPAGTLPFPATDLGVPTKATFKRFNYRIALDHKFSPDILGYVSYNTGFKSGGFVLAKRDADPFKPEDIKAAEVGLKTQFLDRRVRLNIAAFRYDYRNIQVQRFDAGSQLIYNGAKAEMYGVDLDGEVILGDGLSLTGGFSYIHDRFKSFPQADLLQPDGSIVPREAAGNKLPQTPTYTFNLGGDYSLETGIGNIRLNANYYRQSKVFAAPDNLTFQKAYDLINASIAWTDTSDNVTVKLWGRNLGKTVYTTSLIEGFTGLDVSYGYPRTYGITAGFKF
ncbi:TonB-dependent receptor [Sphingobium sp. CECT 9361]|uniref:TonB-dependent receptor n=1 Tax=Sphingobium sp. CECT 9361 TaxID=2845384 RepID=UPI001E3F3409|nr:TonB-dependent receptor [Sphingobium sp. CECT 9361]CAH0357055.1 Pesticin receptor [Sphingobium sp. CECT 9361]